MANRLPIQQGQVIEMPFTPTAGPALTEMEQKILEQTDWQAGDPIPDLGDTAAAQRISREIARLRNAAREVDVQKELKGIKTAPLPKLQDIATLSEAEQREIQALLGQARTVAKAASGPMILDDLSPLQEEEDAAQDPSGVVEQLKELQAKLDQEHKQPEEDLTPPDVSEVSVEDLRNYTQCQLGNLRFRKEFLLLGGLMRIVFRELTSKEENAAKDRVDYEARSREIINQVHYDRRIEEYLLLMSIEEIAKNDNETKTYPPFDGTKIDLPELREVMYNEVMPLASTKRAITRCWKEFNACLHRLEEATEHENFIDAIVMSD